MENQMDLREFQINRHSVHMFANESLNEEQHNKLLEIIAYYDCKNGPSGQKTRLTLVNEQLCKGIIPPFKNQLGYIVASAYIPENKKNTICQTKIECDLGYKLYMVSIKLASIGIGSCFATHSLDSHLVESKMKAIHPMGFIAPVALAFGIPEKTSSVYENLRSFASSSTYRNEISEFAGSVPPKFASALESVQHAPSSGNSQSWQLSYRNNLVKGSETISFYAVTEMNDRFINVGCAMAAFELAKSGGKWSLDQVPQPDQEFCFSYSLKLGAK